LILLDTNVVSELMRPSPEPNVVRWTDAQDESELWISAVTMAEIRLGLALLPKGKRRNRLIELAEQMFREDFAGQCLPFDCEAAAEYARIVSARTRLGHPISVEDAQIAAIAITGGLTLATRNTKDFLNIGLVSLLNPWEAKG